MSHFSKLLLLVFFLISPLAYAEEATVIGKWKTIDEKSGEPKAIVDVFQRDGALYGEIVYIFPKPDQPDDPICKKCKGDNKDKKILGMEIIQGLTELNGVWQNGKILDPENGKEYACSLWLEDGKLRVRGHILFLYRTQTWLPVEDES